MSADLALQKAIRLRLVANGSVLALVPAGSIIDRNARPALDPSVVIGESQSIEGGRISRNIQEVFATLHLWKREQGTEGVKLIAESIRLAIRSAAFGTVDGFDIRDCHVTSARFLRDPDGQTAHGVVMVQAWLCEAA